METSRAIQENLTDLAIKAQALLNTAKAQGRELTDDEAVEFDDLYKVQIPAQKKKLEVAEERDRQQAELATQLSRQSAAQGLTELLNQSPNAPRRVLPTNGRLPEEEGGESGGRVYHRMGRLKAFKDERTAYNAGMWLRAIVAREYHRGEDTKAIQHCQRVGLEINNTSTEGVGSAGGYLVPAPIAATIIDVREQVGVARQICDIQPLTSDTLSIPKRAGGLTVYYPGEGGTITTSDKTWGQIELISKKRAVASYISQELVDDALINVVDNVMSEMAYALALQEDNELINGTGASTYGNVRGLLNKIGSAGIAQAVTGHDTWPELDISDVTSCVGLLPQRFARNPVWICSRNFYYTAMLNILAKGGGNKISDLASGPGGQRMFLGDPVYFTSQMPTSTAAATVCALYGDFTMAAILGDRGGLRIQRDDSVQFLADLTTLKATSRYDFNVHQPGTSSVVGAYVALKTAA